MKYTEEWGKFVDRMKLGDDYTKEEIMLNIGFTCAAIADELQKIRKQMEREDAD